MENEILAVLRQYGLAYPMGELAALEIQELIDKNYEKISL